MSQGGDDSPSTRGADLRADDDRGLRVEVLGHEEPVVHVQPEAPGTAEVLAAWRTRWTSLSRRDALSEFRGPRVEKTRPSANMKIRSPSVACGKKASKYIQ